MSTKEPKDAEDLKRGFEDTAKSLGLSGIILQSSAKSRIDYDRSRDELDDAGFSVEAVPVDNSATELQSISKGQSIAAIIPAYNEADSLPEVITATAPYVDDVFVIDDASTDDTEAVAREHADEVVSLPKNMGVGGAVDTGYRAAIRSGYDIVIQIDGDGQHDPSYIPKMLETMEDRDADMVIGSRWLNDSYQDYSLVRRMGIKFFTAEVNVLGGVDITDVTSGFRAYRASMLDDLGRPANSHWALEQTLEAGRKEYIVEEISVPMPPDTDGSQFDIETFAKYPPRMMLTTLKTLLLR
ncbi:glycosyl transferase [Halorubrum kocurii JCM 14978]|uniref:Glycosyl transferase n=1 Tax=Halorubrum kocurii JCM 14978 TaxID=1230456 RepID=M0PNB4_9EURY|nr:glycosyl transferase [Halorubrum kocurii JCM 14978]